MRHRQTDRQNPQIYNRYQTCSGPSTISLVGISLAIGDTQHTLGLSSDIPENADSHGATPDSTTYPVQET